MLDASTFDPIPPERERYWIERVGSEPFHAWLGLRFEEIRLDYARLRLAFRPELLQGGAVVHGAALAAALDTVAVGAVLSAHETRPARTVTLDLSVRFLGGVREGDVIADARVRRRGRTIVFLEADAYDIEGRPAAHAEMTWMAAD
jgi:uncharacterized protein (TIGR00369 family)